MAKRAPAAKPIPAQPQDQFVELMLVSAAFVSQCGGMSQAKKALDDAGRFIERAGSVAKATQALSVLESLRDKISG